MAKGSVRKKGKKWYYRFYIEDESGNRVQKEYPGTESKSETGALLRRAMAEADHIAEDEGLKKSLMRYAIESGAVIEKVYRREMETPVEDMKRFMDGLLHIYDEGRTKMKIGDLLDMSSEARERLNGQN